MSISEKESLMHVKVRQWGKVLKKSHSGFYSWNYENLRILWNCEQTEKVATNMSQMLKFLCFKINSEKN